MNIKEFNGLNSLNKKEDGTEMSHEEIYSNVVNAIGLHVIERYLPVSKEEIKKALEKDEHLNNIPLEMWDQRHNAFKSHFVRIGINRISLSDTVCTLKQGARMLVKE